MLKFISLSSLLLFSFSLTNFATANNQQNYSKKALAFHEEVDGKSEATKTKRPKAKEDRYSCS